MTRRIVGRYTENGRTFTEYAYECLECRDTGFVTIFRPEVVQRAMSDPDSVVHWSTCAAKCYCDRGQVKRVKAGIFGAEWWHVNASGDDARAEAAMLRAR